MFLFYVSILYLYLNWFFKIFSKAEHLLTLALSCYGPEMADYIFSFASEMIPIGQSLISLFTILFLCQIEVLLGRELSKMLYVYETANWHRSGLYEHVFEFSFRTLSLTLRVGSFFSYLGFNVAFTNTGPIATGSFEGKGNRYIQYFKLLTVGKQLPTFPHTVRGLNGRPQRWEVSVLPLPHRGSLCMWEHTFDIELLHIAILPPLHPFGVVFFFIGVYER